MDSVVAPIHHSVIAAAEHVMGTVAIRGDSVERGCDGYHDDRDSYEPESCGHRYPVPPVSDDWCDALVGWTTSLGAALAGPPGGAAGYGRCGERAVSGTAQPP